jgi:hypothetical protein
MKKVLLLVLSVLLVLSLVVGCAGSTTEPMEKAKEKPAEAKSEANEEEAGEKIKLKIMIMSEDSNRQAIYQDYYEARIGDVFPDYEVEFELPGSEDNYNSNHYS